MRREQAELRGRQHFWTELRVDPARFDVVRGEKTFETVAQDLAPMREGRGRESTAALRPPTSSSELRPREE